MMRGYYDHMPPAADELLTNKKPTEIKHFEENEGKEFKSEFTLTQSEA